jgi:hypothetical protein
MKMDDGSRKKKIELLQVRIFSVLFILFSIIGIIGAIFGPFSN